MRVWAWAEFEKQALAKIRRMAARSSQRQLFTDKVLFRGQADANWGLTTTLQRTTGKPQETAADYHRRMQKVHGSIIAFLERSWDMDTILHLPGFEVKGVEFMAYLRQNGFPSPLLDWTQSPYIAAYFAFRDVQGDTERHEHVSIYTYEELSGEDGRVQMDFQNMETPSVCTIGPYLATDKKHHLQQCHYTLCLSGDRDNYRYVEYPAEIVTSDTRPCLIEKYKIALSEQKEVLRRLGLMNVTTFSLFGVEAALGERLGSREFFPQVE